MLNSSFKNNQKSTVFNGGQKRKPLLLNLHTMPQTITSHWTRWLFLGLIIFGIFLAASLLLYFFTK